MDEYLDGYYIQGRVEFFKNGKWEGRIRPGTGIVRLIAVEADGDADKVFSGWVKSGQFGKQYQLPGGAKVIAKINIRT